MSHYIEKNCRLVLPVAEELQSLRLIVKLYVCVQSAACKVLFAGGRQLLTRPSVLCHHNIPVTANVTYAKHQLSKMAMVGWRGGNNREKTNIRVRLQKGGKNIPWKLDPSGVKVVCDCIFCFPRLLFRVILVSHNFTIPPIATFCTTLSADEPAVRSNLKIGKHGLFPFTSHLLHYDKI